MKWTKLVLTTTSEAEDLVINMLNDLGIDSVEISDNVPITEEEKKQMFIDILPELNEEDHTATLSFYLQEDDNVEEMKKRVQEGLKELSTFVTIGSGIIEVTQTEDKDWINNWKEFFKPFRVDESIVIKPTWETLEQVSKQDIVVEIDPGVAFGTGSHETTKLCILNLKKYMKEGQRILDVGCGSGILSIIGLKLGAKNVVATDIDPNAVIASIENAKVNHINANTQLEAITSGAASLAVLSGDIISDEMFRETIGEQEYDIVVANILADIIMPLSKVIDQNMKPGGLFISSGIIKMKRDAVKEELKANGFELLEETTMGDWVSFVAKKR